MRRFNLLREPRSIRDTLQPGDAELILGSKRRKRPFVLGAVALILAVVWGAIPMLQPREAPPVKKTVVVEAETKPDQREVADITEQAPDAVNDEIAPIISRPVAQDATPVETAKPVEKSWRIRFGVCVYKTSCDGVARNARAKGIDAVMMETVSRISLHKLVIGPWASANTARQTMGKLKKEGIEVSILIAEGKHYLESASVADPASADKLERRLKTLGHRVRQVKSGETRKVYKVYAKESYKTEAEAAKEMDRLKKNKLDCVVEAGE